MQIKTVVQLESDDAFAYTPEAAAAQVLAALGGNPTNDYSTVELWMPNSVGDAGTPPPPSSEPE
jgi:hypothetical protein